MTSPARACLRPSVTTDSSAKPGATPHSLRRNVRLTTLKVDTPASSRSVGKRGVGSPAAYSKRFLPSPWRSQRISEKYLPANVVVSETDVWLPGDRAFVKTTPSFFSLVKVGQAAVLASSL